MENGYLKRLKSKAKRLLLALKARYPLRSGLNFKNNYQLFVAVILSAQCSDKKVNEVTRAFFKVYPNFKKLAEAKIEDVERLLNQINYFKTKSKNLIKAAKILSRRKFPLNYDELIKLPGVGDKTAQVILACNGIPSFPVDTHVARVSRRLGLSEAKAREKISMDLKRIFPKEDWINLHHALIWHGREICKSGRPKCNECVISKLCQTAYEYRK